MKYRRRLAIPGMVALIAFLVWIVSGHALAEKSSAEQTTSENALKSLSALEPIDVHTHVFKIDPAFQAFLERVHLKLVDILVVDDSVSNRKTLEPQLKDALALVHSSRGHEVLCTTFDAYKFNDASFVTETIKQLDRNFDQGAVGVKIWKNIGMEIKDSDGNFILPDNPKFTPIYEEIAKRGKTLMSHVAEPDVAWGPPDPTDPSWSYYKKNPQWYLGGKSGYPSKKAILDARDHILASNPKLRMVGVHLGSMEKDLDGIAQRLDRYPNFAIDTAARMDYLMLAPRDKVRAFLIKYQDRILYGTDLDLLADANVDEELQDWRSTYVRDWMFLATDQTVEHHGRKSQGLKLPDDVLRKIYRTNALHWFPGLDK